MCILEDIFVDKNNTYHSTIRIKPADVKLTAYTNFYAENNDKDPKFEVGDHVRISKYENVFTKSYIPNWSEDEFVIQKVKNTVLCAYTYIIIDLNGK